MRYEIHFTIKSGDDAAVERAINDAYDLVEEQLHGLGTLTAQASLRLSEDGPPKPTGWDDWDDETEEAFYRRQNP